MLDFYFLFRAIFKFRNQLEINEKKMQLGCRTYWEQKSRLILPLFNIFVW